MRRKIRGVCCLEHQQGTSSGGELAGEVELLLLLWLLLWLLQLLQLWQLLLLLHVCINTAASRATGV